MEVDDNSQYKNTVLKLHKSIDLAQSLLAEAKNDNLGKVVDLLWKGAGFSIDELGTSPLHWAAYNNSCKMAELFLNQLASPNGIENKARRTPLHVAALGGYSNLVRLLLNHGADPNFKDMLGMTPLHSAADSGSVDCVHHLLQYGANPTIINRFGKTPLDMARRKQFSDIINLFQDPPAVLADIKCTKSLKIDCINHTNLNKQLNKEYQSETLELLKEHGIQMLEPDQNGSVVMSAIESGRKIVLTQAGKLALKTLPDTSKVVVGKSLDNLDDSPLRKTAFKNIVINGNKVLRIDPNQVNLIKINNEKMFIDPPKVYAARVFEGKLYKEEEDDILINKLKGKISNLKQQGSVLEALSKKKYEEADLWRKQLLSLLRLKGVPSESVQINQSSSLSIV